MSMLECWLRSRFSDPRIPLSICAAVVDEPKLPTASVVPTVVRATPSSTTYGLGNAVAVATERGRTQSPARAERRPPRRWSPAGLLCGRAPTVVERSGLLKSPTSKESMLIGSDAAGRASAAASTRMSATNVGFACLPSSVGATGSQRRGRSALPFPWRSTEPSRAHADPCISGRYRSPGCC
jgi:hypothetical protein